MEQLTGRDSKTGEFPVQNSAIGDEDEIETGDDAGPTRHTQAPVLPIDFMGNVASTENTNLINRASSVVYDA